VRPLVVGTRGSNLALWQTNFVIEALKKTSPELEIEPRILRTAGDRDPNRPLDAFGGRGVFTDAIEDALREREIDLAVHSLKDIPTKPNEDLTLAAILERADARDVIVSRHNARLMELPKRAKVGTGSTRRAAQVLALRPDIEIVPLRGNVDTRLSKAKTADYDAIVLAAAGILRLGRGDEITQYLPLDAFLPDPGQGALAVQIRTDDVELAELVQQIDHAPTRAATTAERAFLAAWGSGCALPIAAYAEIHDSKLHLRGLIGTRDGQRILRGENFGSPTHAEELGYILAENLKQRGANELLK
jgi:hydroxymethylbilane synthase